MTEISRRGHARSCFFPCLLALALVLVGCETDLENADLPQDTRPSSDAYSAEAPPELANHGAGGPAAEPAISPAASREQLENLQQAWGIRITGDWTPEGLALLEKCLAAYAPKKSALGNLQRIHMIDTGETEPPYYGLMSSLDCDVGLVEGCATTGIIRLWGSQTLQGSDHRPRFGPAMTAEHVIQHEIGHYFAVALASDQDWRTRFREETTTTVTKVSAYGDSSKEERLAEVWSKLLTSPGQAPASIDWTLEKCQPDPDFLRFGVTRKLASIVRENVKTELQSAFLGKHWWDDPSLLEGEDADAEE